MRGTRANLVIRQDEAQHFKATLYLEPGEGENQQAFGSQAFSSTVDKALGSLSDQNPGLSGEPSEFGWKIKIPEAYDEGHEAHFTRVTQRYLQYLDDEALPAWERTNLLTKYFITTQAYALSREEKPS